MNVLARLAVLLPAVLLAWPSQAGMLPAPRQVSPHAWA